MNKKILFIDTETGGVNPEKSSLLSIGLVVWSDKRIVDTKEIFIKHDVFHVTPQALLINQINFLEFLDTAVYEQSALSEVKNFIEKYFQDEVGNIVLGGHNTNFDINFIRKFIADQGEKFENWFSHRFVDTAAILKFLYYADKLEEDISSSDKAFEYFNIMVKKRHSALDDAIATAELFNCLLKMIRNE